MFSYLVLAPSLTHLPNISPIPSRTSLWGNRIGPEGARALAEALRTNTTLIKL